MLIVGDDLCVCVCVCVGIMLQPDICFHRKIHVCDSLIVEKGRRKGEEEKGRGRVKEESEGGEEGLL